MCSKYPTMERIVFFLPNRLHPADLAESEELGLGETMFLNHLAAIKPSRNSSISFVASVENPSVFPANKISLDLRESFDIQNDMDRMLVPPFRFL